MISSHVRREASIGFRLFLALPIAAAATAALVACSSSGTPTTSSTGSGTAAATAGTLKTAKIGGATALTNSKGFTLYSFAPDTSTKSNCNGACAANWPPVKGPVSAAGVKGTFATIKRTDGSTQATFDGHPLYTFAGDSAPGQANGNGVTADGGVWHEITTSGPAAAAGSPGGAGY